MRPGFVFRPYEPAESSAHHVKRRWVASYVLVGHSDTGAACYGETDSRTLRRALLPFVALEMTPCWWCWASPLQRFVGVRRTVEVVQARDSGGD